MKRFLLIGLGLLTLAWDAPPAAAQSTEEVAALLEQLKSGKPAAQSRALASLAALGPDAKESIPPLIDTLGHETAGFAVTQALGRIGSAAVPALVKALRSDNARVRANAAAALKSMGPAARDAVPGLMEVVKKDRGTRTDAVAQPPALPRIQAIGALAQIGPAARDAVPVLIDVLKEKDALDGARIEAAVALGLIGPDAGEAVPVLAAVIQGPETKFSPLRLHAATALGQIGPAAKEAVPALIEVVKDRKAGPARLVVVRALGEIGPGASAAVRPLEEALDEPSLREAARLALDRIQGKK
jgi:HEAT repeat protein